MLVKGDSRWVTALHYAFQDEEYLVRTLSRVGGELPGKKGEGPWGPEALGPRRERPSDWDQEVSTPLQLPGLQPLIEAWLGAGQPRATGRHSPVFPEPHGAVGDRALGQVPPTLPL